jgi:hypothetical protein
MISQSVRGREVVIRAVVRLGVETGELAVVGRAARYGVIGDDPGVSVRRGGSRSRRRRGGVPGPGACMRGRGARWVDQLRRTT